MTSELFTADVPKNDHGFRWVKYTTASQPEVVFLGKDGTVKYCGSLCRVMPSLWGPRIDVPTAIEEPTP